MRKAVSVLLAAVIIFALCATEAAASGGAVISGDDKEALRGGVVEYSVRITNNPGIAGYRLTLSFDTTVLSLAAAASSTGETVPECRQGSFSEKGATLCSATETGCQVVWYYANANAESDGTLFTLMFNVADNAPFGEYPVSISCVSRDVVDVQGEPIPVSCAGGCVTVREAAPAISGDKVSLVPGEEAEFTVRMKDNPGIAGFIVTLAYDTDSLEPVATTDGNNTVPDVTRGDFTDKGSMLSAVQSGGCRVQWYNTTDISSDGTLFSLRFKLKDGAALGVYPITVGYEADSTVNTDEQQVSFAAESGTISAVSTRLFDGVISNGVISYKLASADVNGLSVVIALYNGEGRNVHCIMHAAKGGDNTETPSYTGEFVRCKVFVLNGQWSPQCEALNIQKTPSVGGSE